ncbi:MAG: hypothetical protein MUC34_20430, partial [Anaerolineae bacterium]|nr:hypothetical protein [Anaerolineae bacterium]
MAIQTTTPMDEGIPDAGQLAPEAAELGAPGFGYALGDEAACAGAIPRDVECEDENKKEPDDAADRAAQDGGHAGGDVGQEALEAAQVFERAKLGADNAAQPGIDGLIERTEIDDQA